MKVKEFITFKLSKFLTALIPAAAISLFGCYTIPKCQGFPGCPPPFIDYSCALIVAGIIFVIIWLAYSLSMSLKK